MIFRISLLALLITTLSTWSQSQAERAWDVYKIFERSCAECHGGHKKPKGDFGYILDLNRISVNENYVVPGKPEESELYLLLVEDDPDFLMPPPKSEVPGLSSNEIQMVYDWIFHGAALGVGEVPTNAPATQHVALEPPSIKEVTGNLHPLIVHFPIALLLVGVLAALIKRRRSEVVTWCLITGTLGAIVSVITGWLHADATGYSPEAVFQHRWLGVACAMVAVFAVWTHALNEPESIRQRFIAFITLILLAGLVFLTGHTGGVLVWGEGFPF